ncbi:MAG TPA: hypothetical protein PKD54_14210 [Pirellulaceae bacterium]|nr:hypothetical protein [Pirellulaceae bacterium]
MGTAYLLASSQVPKRFMVFIEFDLEDGEPMQIDLRNPFRAAWLAWLWPGAGHFYQGRFTKGFVIMICVLSLFTIGLVMGRGRVVYASTAKNDFRWQYLFQVGVGLPAAPALFQSVKTGGGGDPWFVLCERYPPQFMGGGGQWDAQPFHRVQPDVKLPDHIRTLKDGFMAPPAGPIDPDNNDVLGMWHSELKHWFEIGTVYTVVAGILNMLAIYDAFNGPLLITPATRRKIAEKREERKQRKRKT